MNPDQFAKNKDDLSAIMDRLAANKKRSATSKNEADAAAAKLLSENSAREQRRELYLEAKKKTSRK